MNDLSEIGQGGISGIWERVKLEIFVSLKSAFDEAIFKISNMPLWLSLK